MWDRRRGKPVNADKSSQKQMVNIQKKLTKIQIDNDQLSSVKLHGIISQIPIK
jgi:hypothetical protein